MLFAPSNFSVKIQGFCQTSIAKVADNRCTEIDIDYEEKPPASLFDNAHRDIMRVSSSVFQDRQSVGYLLSKLMQTIATRAVNFR